MSTVSRCAGSAIASVRGAIQGTSVLEAPLFCKQLEEGPPESPAQNAAFNSCGESCTRPTGFGSASGESCTRPKGFGSASALTTLHLGPLPLSRLVLEGSSLRIAMASSLSTASCRLASGVPALRCLSDGSVVDDEDEPQPSSPVALASESNDCVPTPEGQVVLVTLLLSASLDAKSPSQVSGFRAEVCTQVLLNFSGWVTF
mmetsp:Transcript_90527/g.264923  ORF Transcript_90527/g.264923 Transcript_90527/m.264923 type:complete len:202 (+) Transcript_90527:187-792(+)